MPKKRLPRDISVRGEVFDALKIKAECMDMAVGRLVDQLITTYLDRKGVPK